ncbi:glycosyl transferase [Alkalimarinus alittae]|uniref:Glycosyl transferase n=1 Tax=Alkalimarinus alittae TaxID=2961619 RepID=A0ABY6N0X9_9ALTE|nr:glycosyl transferase [Alkalimarinus alittae]UZE95758.1 glycosyl transferase [Alkalimarinus alittae]
MLRLTNKKKQQALLNTQLLKQKSLYLALRYQDFSLNKETLGVCNTNEHEIIISLTTFGYRVNDVHLTIESLFQQSVKASRIILWLSTRDFPNKELDIPSILKKQAKRGLEIAFCEEDLGPYTKFFYTLKKHPESLIVTVDDDILYANDTIDLLYRAYLKDPKTIHCLRAHKMLLDKTGQLLPYKKWEKVTQEKSPALDIFPTGVGGVLYFPNCFDDEIFNKGEFLKLAPNSDDVWLKAMSLKKGTYCQKVLDERPWEPRNVIIEGSQKYSLKRKNKSREEGNDPKIKAVFDKYNLLERLYSQ